MGHGMIALTAPTISMQMHRHAKYAQHSTLLPSQTRRLSQSCTAWHAAPAPRQRHNARSAVRHSNPRTCFHTHADITCTQPGARACTASQTRSPGTPSHRHVHGVRTGQTCAFNLCRDSQNTRKHFCRQFRENPASIGTCRGSTSPSPLHCKRSHLHFPNSSIFVIRSTASTRLVRRADNGHWHHSLQSKGTYISGLPSQGQGRTVRRHEEAA